MNSFRAPIWIYRGYSAEHDDDYDDKQTTQKTMIKGFSVLFCFLHICQKIMKIKKKI